MEVGNIKKELDPALVAWIVRASITINVVVSGDRWIESPLKKDYTQYINIDGFSSVPVSTVA